jgi:DNA-binding MltR family transcriptional regulator
MQRLDSKDSKDEEVAFYTHDSNRAVAVVWAAIIENRLTDVIKTAIRKDEKIASELFDPGGPLGNFGTKIRVAFMLGLVNRNVTDNLLIINKIRNKFAHRAEPEI